ncbi:MAG: McrC family protein, partial [Candidatus Odinarchaeia archaeon]
MITECLSHTNTKHIICTEYSVLRGHRKQEFIAKNLSRINRELKLRKEIKGNIVSFLQNNAVNFGNFVGFIKIGDITLELLPKLINPFDDLNEKTIQTARVNLFRMLSYVYEFTPRFDKTINVIASKRNLLEVLIFLFAEALDVEVNRGLFREYVEEELRSRYLRGTLQVEKQLRNIDKTWFEVKTREYTANNELNKFLKIAAKKMIGLTRDKNTKRKLENIYKLMDDVKETPIERIKFNKITFNRLNNRFKPIYDTAMLILLRSAFSFTASKLNIFYFIMDMNRLFEAFFTNFLMKHRAEVGLREFEIFPQTRGRLRYMFIDERTENNFFMEIPDIKITRLNSPQDIALIIDTKYKILPDNSKHSPHDLYQIKSYCDDYDADALIIYPNIKETSLDPHPLIIQKT